MQLKNHLMSRPRSVASGRDACPARTPRRRGDEWTEREKAPLLTERTRSPTTRTPQADTELADFAERCARRLAGVLRPETRASGDRRADDSLLQEEALPVYRAGISKPARQAELHRMMPLTCDYTTPVLLEDPAGQRLTNRAAHFW